MILTNKDGFGARNNIQWLCCSGKQLFINTLYMPRLTFI